MQWYYSKNGTQLGPIELSELNAKLSSGEVSAADLVWREGMADWLPASKVDELQAGGGTRTVSPVADAPLRQDPYVAPAASPVPASYGPMVKAPGSGKATTSMVLGIVAVVFGLCGCYGLVISVTCGILAVVFGNQFKKEAAINPALVPELGKAKAGVITGWIGIALSVLLTVLFIVMGLASGVMSEMNR